MWFDITRDVMKITQIFTYSLDFKFYLYFWDHVIFVPLSGIKTAPPAAEVQNLNHCTAREVSYLIILEINLKRKR